VTDTTLQQGKLMEIGVHSLFGTKRSLRKAILFQGSSRHSARRRLAKSRRPSNRREGQKVMVKISKETRIEIAMDMNSKPKLNMEQKPKLGMEQMLKLKMELR
jgi:hypothetical protein